MSKTKPILVIFSALALSFLFFGAGTAFACCGGGGVWQMFHQNWHHSGYTSCPLPPSPQLIWQYNIGVGFSTPVYDTDAAHTYATLFIASNSSYVYAYNDNTHFLRWSKNLGTGVKSTPLYDNSSNRLYVGSGTQMYALNKTSGATIYNYTAGGNIRSSPATIPGTGKIYFGADDGVVYALNSTGSAIWKFRTAGPVISSPAIYENGVVFVGSADNKVYAINVSTGKQKWAYTTGGDVNSTPTTPENQEKVFVGSADGNVYALNRSTGALVWNYTTGGPVISSPAVNKDSGNIYVGSNDNNVYALNSTGGFRWIYATADDVKASPAVSDGKVLVNSIDGHIYMLSEADGSLIWDYSSSTPTSSSPIIENYKIYVGTNSKVLVFGSNPVDATIDIDPDTINLGSNGKWITAYIEVDGYDLSTIDTSAVLLEGVVPATGPSEVGDYDSDGIADLMVKFDRQAVSELLSPGEAELTVTGKVWEVHFKGSDTVDVIG